MPWCRFAAFIVLLSVIVSWGASAEKTQVQWLTGFNINEPKQHSIKHNQNTESYNLDGDTLKIILEHAPKLEITLSYTNIERTFLLLDNKPDACVGNKVVNSRRKKKYLYSQLPQVVFPGQRIFINVDSPMLKQIQSLNHAGRISVEDVLKLTQNTTIGLNAGFSYGETLDGLFNQYRDKVWRRRGSSSAKEVTNMFFSGRFDAVIEYPSVFEYYVNKLNKSSTDFVSFSIKELPEYILGYIVCAKSDTGQQAIQQFDAALRKSVTQKSYLNAHLKWFKQDIHADITRYYNQVYGTSFSAGR